MIKLSYIKGYINPMLFDSYSIRTYKDSNTKILQLDFLNDINIITAFSNKWICAEMQNMVSNTKMLIKDHSITLEYEDDELAIHDLELQIFGDLVNLNNRKYSSVDDILDNLLLKCKMVKHRLLTDEQQYILETIIKNKNDSYLKIVLGHEGDINDWNILQDINTWSIEVDINSKIVAFNYSVINYPSVSISDCDIYLVTKEEAINYITRDIIPCMCAFEEYIKLNELEENVIIDDNITALIYKDGGMVCRWNLEFLYKNRNVDIKSIIDNIFNIKTANIKINRGV